MAYVYILKNGDSNYYKIGRTKGDIEKRRKSLSTGNPQPLSLFDFIETEHDVIVEKFLHIKFFDKLSKEGDSTEFYKIDPVELKNGLQEAKNFLAEYIPHNQAAEKLKVVESNGCSISPDDEILKIYHKLCRIKGIINNLQFEKEILENQLKSKIGNNDGIDGIATWKTQTQFRLDQKTFKEKHPDIYQAFAVESKTRIFKTL